jgi:hypothetical protein
MANPKNTLYAIYAEDDQGIKYGVSVSKNMGGINLQFNTDEKRSTICFGYDQAERFLKSSREKYNSAANKAKRKAEATKRLFLRKVKMSEFIVNEDNWHIITPAPRYMNKEAWMKKYSKCQRRPYEAWKVIAND